MIKKKLGVTKPTFKFDLQRFDGETVFPATLDKDTDGAYLIKTAEDLQALSNYLKTDDTKCAGLTFKLTAASEVIEVPENCDLSTFAGTIDGNGNILRGVNNSIGGTVKDLNYTGTATISGETNAKYHFISLPDGATVDGASSDTPSGVFRTDDGQNIFLQDGGTFTISNFSAGKEITFDSTVTLSATDDAKTFTAKVGDAPAFTLQLNVNLADVVTAHWNEFTFVSEKTAETLSADGNKITYNAATGGEEIFTISGITKAPDLPGVDANSKYTITLPSYSYYDGTNISITKKDDSVIGAAINAPYLNSNSSITVDFEAKVTVSASVGTVTINGKTYSPYSGNAVIDTTADTSTLYSGTVTVENGKALTTTNGKELTTDDQAIVTVAEGAVTSITKLFYNKSVTYDGKTYTAYSNDDLDLHYISDGTHYYSYDYNNTELLELGKTITNYIDVAITGNTIDLTQVTGDTAVFVDADNKAVAVYSQNILKITDENTYTVKSTKFFAVKTKGNRIYNPSGEIEVSASATATALTKGTVSLEPESQYYSSPYNIRNNHVTVGENDITLSEGDGFTVNVDDNGTVTFGELNTADGKADSFEVTNTTSGNFDIYTFATNGIIKESYIEDFPMGKLTGSFVHAAGTSFTLSDTNWTAVETVGKMYDDTTGEPVYILSLTGDEISYIDDTAQIVANYTTANGLTAAEGYTVSDNFYVTANAAGTFTISKDFKNFITYINVNDDWIEQIYEVTTKDDASTYSITVTEDDVQLDTANISAVTYKADDANDNRTLTFGDGVVDLADGDNTYRQALTDDGKISFSKLLPTASDWNLYNGTATVTDSLTIYGGKELYVSGGTATAKVTNGAVESVNLTGNGAAVKYKPQTYGYFYYARISGTDDAAVTVNYDDGCNYTVSGINNGETLTICGSTDGNIVYNILTATAISGEISATITVSDSGAASISSVSGLTAGDKFNCTYKEYEVLQNGILYFSAGYSQYRLYQLNEGTVDFTNYLSASPIQSATINDETINYIAFPTGDVVYVDATAKIIAESKDGTLIKKDDTATNYYLCPTTAGTIPSDFTKIYYYGNLFTVDPSGDDYTFGYDDDGNFIFDTTKITKITSQTENFEFTFENGVALKRSTDDTNITYGQAFSNNQFIVDQLVTFATLEDWEEENNWGLYSGEVTVTNSLKIYDGTTLSVDTGEITATVTNGALTAISKPAEADSVTISLGEPGGNNATQYHIENGKISKFETELNTTTNEMNVKEYEATLGNVTNIFDVAFGTTSTNEFSVSPNENTVTLTKGKISNGLSVQGGVDVSAGYELVNSTDGVTFKFANNKITGVVADSFTAGESFKVGDVTYTNVDGKISRSSDNKVYSGEFNALFAENATWKAEDYWKLEDDKLNRFDGETNEKLFGISGLNLDLTESEVAYEIDGVTVENQKVEISSSIVGNSQIEVDGAGYTFQIKNANVKVANAEKITGTDGGDRITLEAEGIVIESGAGADRISLSATSKNNTIYGGAGNDTIFGNDEENIFVYTDGNDVIKNYKGKISISGGEIEKGEVSGANVILTTSNGKITVEGGADKAITVVDGEGKELTQIYSAHATYNADQTAMSLSSSASGEIAAPATVIEIDATNSKKSLHIVGNDNANKITANDKNSTLEGGAGDDTLIGGDGKNTFVYSAGNDVINDFDASKDKVKLSDVEITKTEIDGSDLIFTTANGTLKITGGAEEKISVESATATQIYTADAIFNTRLTEMTLQSSASGEIAAESKVKSIDATAVENPVTITANANANTIQSGAGADSIFSNAGNDKIFGNDGNDTLNGGAGNDELTGGDGADLFIYNGGKDIITDFDAAEDSLQIEGTISNVSLNGADVIFKTNVGNLTVKNAKDAEISVGDKFYFNALAYDSTKTSATLDSRFGGTLENYSASIKTIDASDGTKAVEIYGNAQNNTILGGKGKDTINGGTGADSIFGGNGNDKLFGEDGDDILNGGAGNDTLTGGDGADLFIYNGGKDIITDFSAAEDTIQIDGTISNASLSGENMIFKTSVGNLTIAGGIDQEITIGEKIYFNNLTYDLAKTTATVDKKFGGMLENYDANIKTIDASEGTKAVEIYGNAQNNTILGGKKNDSIYGDAGADSIFGGAGNDKLYGEDGNDTLNGGAGNDTLWGGYGNDTLIGDAGKDIFVYENGNDVITDYTAGQDKIKLVDVEITETEIDGGDLIFKTSNGNLTVKDGDGKRITVIDSDGKSTTQIYKATDSAKAEWFDEYDNNFVTDEFGLDDIITPVESNFTASKTETFGTANEFNFENSLVSADDK